MAVDVRAAREHADSLASKALGERSDQGRRSCGAGGLDRSRWLAGAEDGPEGKSVPNITPHRATGIGRWSAGDIGGLLKSGRKPDFDTIQGVMAEAIEHGYRYLSDGDRAAIADYVMSLPPIDNRIGRAPAQSQSEYE